MREKFMMDLGKMLDDIFEAAQEFKDVFSEEGPFGSRGKWHGWKWEENADYYPSYSYPPVNVYMTPDKALNFEFALAGFEESDVRLEFKGEYMVFAASAPAEARREDEVRYFKRRLKLKDIPEQKYYVPEDKFDRNKVEAVFRNGILRVTVPPREDAGAQEGQKIDIKKEGT